MVNLNCILATYLEWGTESAPHYHYLGAKSAPGIQKCVQLGIGIRDLDLLTIGLVNDMYAENSNDDYKGYKEVTTHEDFDKF